MTVLRQKGSFMVFYDQLAERQKQRHATADRQSKWPRLQKPVTALPYSTLISHLLIFLFVITVSIS